MVVAEGPDDDDDAIELLKAVTVIKQGSLCNFHLTLLAERFFQ